MSQNILKPTRQILIDDTDVAAFIVDDEDDLSPHIFCDEIPKKVVKAMPRKMILIRRASGAPTSGTGGYLQLERAGIEVLCHGETLYEARLLYHVVEEALKQALRQLKEGVLIHGFDLAGSPQSLKYSDTEWPYIASTWNLLASEAAAT